LSVVENEAVIAKVDIMFMRTVPIDLPYRGFGEYSKSAFLYKFAISNFVKHVSGTTVVEKGNSNS
jgi:hypothetical protein